MAILRGGKRIGGHDIRIGLPRDRSLDNVNSDPRLRQKAGGNPETTMGRFQAYVNEAEGFQRKARFYVEFGMPNGVTSEGRPPDLQGGDEAQGFSSSVTTHTMRTDSTKKRVQALTSFAK